MGLLSFIKEAMSIDIDEVRRANELEDIKGFIGHYNLTEWWLDNFSEEERIYIVEKYTPLGSDEKILIEGKFTQKSQASIYLSGLSQFFSTKKDLHIAIKMLEKASELINSKLTISDLHFYYMHNIKIYYKDRENLESLNKAIEFCNKQIGIAPLVKETFLIENPSHNLPTHTGYEQLAIIEEKRKNLTEALRLSKQAKEEGWGNDWDSRILKLENKLNK